MENVHALRATAQFPSSTRCTIRENHRQGALFRRVSILRLHFVVHSEVVSHELVRLQLA